MVVAYVWRLVVVAYLWRLVVVDFVWRVDTGLTRRLPVAVRGTDIPSLRHRLYHDGSIGQRFGDCYRDIGVCGTVMYLPLILTD